jgi:hypothetical protein
MSDLGLTVYEDSTKASMIANWSTLGRDVVFETGPHGFANLTAFIPMSLEEAFRIYDATPLAHVVLSDGAFTAFEGRLEDRLIIGNERESGLGITAFGYWRAFYDAPYTALWSWNTFDGDWYVMNADDDNMSIREPAKYVIQNDNRIYIALRKNESYEQNDEVATIGFWLPFGGERTLIEVDYDYDVTLPTGYRFTSETWDEGMTGNTTEQTVNGNGASQTGTANLTVTTGKEVLLFNVWNVSADDDAGGPLTYHTITQDTGDWFVTLTNIAIRTTSSNDVYADEIAKDLVSFISTLNSTQLSSSTALIDSPNVSMKDILYKDEWPGDILKDLGELGDDSTPPVRYEPRVWEGQRLQFKVVGSGQDYYVDAAAILVDGTADTLYNDAYTLYRDVRGREIRTATNPDTASVSKYGVTRRQMVNLTGDATFSQSYRDAQIEASKDIVPRASVESDRFYTAAGAAVPKYMIRSGDTLTIRNLPAGSGGVVDNIRSFYIARTRYDVERNILSVTPGAALGLPDLGTMVAANAADILKPGRGTQLKTLR